MPKRLLLAALLLAPALGRADEFDGKKELNTDERAAISLDQEEAHKAIDKKYEGDASPEARRAKAAEYRDADGKVLDDHKVGLKDYTWQSSHDSPDAQKEIEDKKKDLKVKREQEAKAKAEAEKKAGEAGEPEVIKGFDDAHPLNLDEPGAPKAKKEPQLDAEGNPIPEVEKGMRDEDMGGPKVEGGDGTGAGDNAGGGEGPGKGPPGEVPKKHKRRHKGGGGEE